MSSLLTRELVHQLLADHNALNGEKNKKEKCNRKKKYTTENEDSREFGRIITKQRDL